MRCKTIRAVGLSLALVAGCSPSAVEPPQAPARPPYTVQRPATPPGGPSAGRPAVEASTPEVSWETDRDRAFAKFLQGHSGGMIRKAAVGIEDRGQLRVEISRSVAPEDTLELTKSLMAGARKDFPERPIVLSLYDPNGDPILKASYKPGEGVHYQIAHGGPSSSRSETPPETTGRPQADPLARSGVTASDRKFAAWAEDHGRDYLRYVQADLERNGRLWFGVTREVKPEDVPRLTRSLLEGAQKEFPRRDLVATVFDPDGERIGKAHLGADGKVRWER